MHTGQSKFLKTFHPSRVILALVFGFGIVLFLFLKDYKPGAFNALNFTTLSIVFLFLALVCMASRDVGYMIRIKVLSDNKLTWRQAFRIIMLWEFTSAVTPSAVGGTSIAVLFVAKEGISVGRSTSIVLATSFLDELYFILMFPLLILFVNANNLFSTPQTVAGESISWANELFWFAIIGYSLKFIYVLLVFYGLFFKPRALKWILLKVFKIPGLRRWKMAANAAGDEIITSSKELRNKPVKFWFKAFGATFLSWSSRYLVVNMIFLAFFIVPDHLLLFAKQLVMWIMMLVSPTPGGSGFAEYIFTRYLAEFIPSTGASLATIAIGLAFVWRLASYYPYLLIGSIILPGWIRSKFMYESKISATLDETKECSVSAKSS
jgi:glycosyltransferase 2 family protein